MQIKLCHWVFLNTWWQTLSSTAISWKKGRTFKPGPAWCNKGLVWLLKVSHNRLSWDLCVLDRDLRSVYYHPKIRDKWVWHKTITTTVERVWVLVLLVPGTCFKRVTRFLTRCSKSPSIQCFQPRFSFSPFCTQISLSPSQVTSVCYIATRTSLSALASFCGDEIYDNKASSLTLTFRLSRPFVCSSNSSPTVKLTS